MKKLTRRSFTVLIFLAVLSLAACSAEPEETNLPVATQPSSPTADQSSIQSSMPTATNTAEPLPTDTAEPLLTDTAEPLPTDTAEPLPTDTAEPLPTDTAEPLATDTAVPLPSATNPPPLPAATATADTPFALLWPVYGEYKNPFLLKWDGPRDDTYQVTLRHRDQNLTINSGPILARDWIVDIPAEQFGNWEWWVTNSSGIQSEIWTFVFQPHAAGGGGEGGGDDSGGSDDSKPPIAPPPRDP